MPGSDIARKATQPRKGAQGSPTPTPALEEPLSPHGSVSLCENSQRRATPGGLPGEGSIQKTGSRQHLGAGQGEDVPWSVCAALPTSEMGSQPRSSEATAPRSSVPTSFNFLPTRCLVPCSDVLQGKPEENRSLLSGVGQAQERQVSHSGCPHQTPDSRAKFKLPKAPSMHTM